jgi:hypothetical protein
MQFIYLRSLIYLHPKVVYIIWLSYRIAIYVPGKGYSAQKKVVHTRFKAAGLAL